MPSKEAVQELDRMASKLDLPDGYRVYVDGRDSDLNVYLVPKVGKPPLSKEEREKIEEGLGEIKEHSIHVYSPKLIPTSTPFGKELQRKFIHLMGLAAPAVYLVWGQMWALALTGFWFPIFLGFDLYRIRYGIPFEAEGLLQNAMRIQEIGKIASHTYACSAFFIAIALFPKGAAVAAILILLLADSSAAVIGTKWGKIKLVGQRTLIGTLTLFLVGTGVALPFVPLFAALIGGVAAASVELAPGNDSFTIPLASGFLMTLAIEGPGLLTTILP